MVSLTSYKKVENRQTKNWYLSLEIVLRYLYYFEIPNNETYVESLLPTLCTVIPFSTHFGNEVHGQFYLESRTFKSVIMDCHGSYI